MTDVLVPLTPGTILSSASAELAKQIQDIVPPGKHGAVMTIVDADGIRIGLAATYKGSVTVSIDVHKGWDRTRPTASLKVKTVF